MIGVSDVGWRDRAWQQAIHPDDLERVRDELERCIAGTRTLDIEYRWRHVEGRDVWVHDTCTPVIGEGGTVEYGWA